MSSGKVPVRVAREVVAKFRADFKDWNVDFRFDHKNRFLDGQTAGEAGAFFQVDEQPIIRVSTVGRPVAEWLYNLIHETCHMDQWMNDDKTWIDCTERFDGVDSADLANLWIAGKIELNPVQREEVFNAIYLNELDAERRAMHKLWELGISEYYDTKRLAQECWAYVNEYLVARDSRCWLPSGSRPYEVPVIVDAQPTSIGAKNGDLRPYFEHYFEVRMGKIKLEMIDRGR